MTEERMINLAGREDACVCVSVRGVSVNVCVYMTGGESLDQGQSSHTNTKTAAHLTQTATERQYAGRQTVTASIVLRYWCFKCVVFCNRQ